MDLIDFQTLPEEELISPEESIDETTIEKNC